MSPERDLYVENLSARYSLVSPSFLRFFCPLNDCTFQDGPKVLDGLTFHIKSGERVGVVGRTGSGKASINRSHHDVDSFTIAQFQQSSVTLALLRCIFTEGNVYLDKMRTSGINLDVLRSHMTIIPQIVSSPSPCRYRYRSRLQCMT